MGGVAGDLNGAGAEDLLVASVLTGQIFTQVVATPGTFQAGTMLSLSAAPGTMIIVDVNGDGRVDLYDGQGSYLLQCAAPAPVGQWASMTIPLDLGNTVLGLLNGDARVDLLTKDNGNGLIGIRLQDP